MNKEDLKKTINFLLDYKALAQEDKQEEVLRLINVLVKEYNSK